LAEPSDESFIEKTEVLYNPDEIVRRTVEQCSAIKFTMDSCIDINGASMLVIPNHPVTNACLDMKSRGVKMRFITEITKDNIKYCKELMKFAETRHLDEITGNFGIGDKRVYQAGAASNRSGPPSELIVSTVKAIVDQQQYFFNMLWKKAIPAVQKIREIEEGIEPIGTRLLVDPVEIFNHMKYAIGNASKRKICSSTGGMQLIYSNFFDLYKKILDKYRNGRGEGIRWIITIDKDNRELVKKFLDAGVQIRHLRNLIPMNFAVDDKYFHATIEKMESGEIMKSLLTSNEPLYINLYNSFFEELWKNGIDAEQRIKDIEEGADIADIEVFQSASRAREVYLDLVKGATKEIFFIFPTPNAFSRQYNMGAVELAEKAAVERNVKVRILVPTSATKLVDTTFQNLTRGYSHKADTRYIEQMSETKATILIVDRKESLVMELRDDSKTNFDEAIGLSTYSNSKAGVLSYVAIFDNLWKQTELYEQIKDSNTRLEQANEQLKMQDKAQREFINIAAHELRTPIQPILGLSDLMLHTKQTNKKRQELQVIIVRNAKRLERLTRDILDITRIESKSLKLKKELFNLSEMLRDAAVDFQNQINKEQIGKANRKLEVIGLQKDLFIEGDKGRIHQVISNLLSNATKFTDEGKIAISATMFDDRIVVRVKDTGSGIDSKVLPKLFTKFATESDSGTGLGLFISKNIIEAHGGNMWGRNNENEKGATFAFSLPSQGIASSKY